jgi:hypothetical protein
MVLRESAGPAPVATAGIIDQLIEHELAKLTSIDAGGDSPFRGGETPLSVEEISGAFQGIASLEDPRNWASDMDDGAVLRLPQQSAKQAQWRESMPTPLPFPAVKGGPRPGGPAGPQPRLATPQAQPAARPEEPAPHQRHAGVLVSLILVLAAVLGVLVYFTFLK